jgi:FkbM family methyltransferase
LKREPDADGWRTWKDLADRKLLNLQALADGFLASEEFHLHQAEVSQPRLIELDGFKIVVRLNDHFIGATIARDKQYEPHVTREVRRRLRPGAVFVDVGANIGYFTLLAATLVGRDGRVIAFEPNPDNVALLTQSIGANAFANIDLHPFAAAEQSQSCVLEVGGTNSTGSLVDGSSLPSTGRRLAVEAVAIDDVLRDLPRADLVKIDIDGAEPRAFQGMLGLIRAHRPALIVEFCPLLIETLSRVPPASFLDQLRGAGYELSVLGPTEPRTAAQSNEEILALHARSGLTHLDLLATPR